MPDDWFRDLADEEVGHQERRTVQRRRPPAMRRSSTLPKNVIITARVAFVAALVLVICTGMLLYSTILVSPSLIRAVVQDVMCDGKLGKSTNDDQDHTPAGVNGSRVPFEGPTPQKGIPVVESKVASNDGRQKVTILLSVLTMVSKFERRNLLRLAYGVQTSEYAEVTVRFAVGRPRDESEKTLVGLESLGYGDIIFLDCVENMNEGKSYTYFSTVAAMGVHYDYVMKTDDDSYVRIGNLGKSLFEQPRTDLYYGYILPCDNQDPYAWYMAGMGYVISWDLVQWVHDSPIPKNMSKGTEDQLMANWFNAGGKAKNRVSKKPLFYDHSDFGGECAHELVPETILVHQVKTPERWNQVLTFFEKDRITLKP